MISMFQDERGFYSVYRDGKSVAQVMKQEDGWEVMSLPWVRPGGEPAEGRWKVDVGTFREAKALLAERFGDEVHVEIDPDFDEGNPFYRVSTVTILAEVSDRLHELVNRDALVVGVRLGKDEEVVKDANYVQLREVGGRLALYVNLHAVGLPEMTAKARAERDAAESGDADESGPEPGETIQ